MKKVLAALLAVVVAVAFVPTVGDTASPCPPEVTQAKELLSQHGQAPRTLAGARMSDLQAPRASDVQAPRKDDVQAPRASDIQAPRKDDIQAPRKDDVQAPRKDDVQAPRLAAARIPQSVTNFLQAQQAKPDSIPAAAPHRFPQNV